MLFYVTNDGEEHRVRIESRRNRLYASYDDGPEERLDLVYHGNDCLFIRDNRVFFANVVGKKTEYTVWNSSGNFNFTVQSEYKRIVSKLRGQDLEQDNSITAKMPGKIVKILTEEGAKVQSGDAVVIMEAMKMENEIRSPSPEQSLKLLLRKARR